MSDVLPSELFWGILNHVPTEPLLRFRRVCIEWRRMIEDPTFIRSHFRRQSGSDRIMIRATGAATATSTTTTTTTKLYTLSLESLCNLENKTTVLAEPISVVVPPHNISRFPNLSCDGLILIPTYYKEEVWSLWNSYTRKSIQLPMYNDDVKRGRRRLCGGLGYDPATDDYKVVRIAQFLDLDSQTYIFETSSNSLKLNKWRRIEDFPNCPIPRRSEDGVFVNGALHWMTNLRLRDGTDYDDKIIALDLGTENYRRLPLPSVLYARNESSRYVYNYLTVMDGCLFIISHSSKYGFEGWMMKDYGGTANSSWTKLFSFKPLPGCEIGEVRLVAYSKNKRQVLIHRSYDNLFWVDVEKKSAKRVSLWGTPYYFTSQVLPASLVPLNNDSKLKLSLAIARA